LSPIATKRREYEIATGTKIVIASLDNSDYIAIGVITGKTATNFKLRSHLGSVLEKAAQAAARERRRRERA
jgi:hypothetical protein